MGNRILERCEGFTRAAEYRAVGIYPYHTRLKRDASCGPAEYTFEGQKLLMFGSNDYLGLTYDPAVRAAAARAATHYGTGCSGSRMLNGTLTIHEQLEAELAAFLQRDAVMLYSTGYQSNFGAISALTRRDDVLFMDRRNHASLVDGCRGNLGKIMRFRYDVPGELAAMMGACRPEQGKLLILDAVFSMEGDIVDLPEVLEVARRHEATVYLDEAHSIGVLGEHGRGVGEHFGRESDVHIVMGTFSKSFGAVGGFIASTAPVIDFLRHHSRSYIFSASLPPPVVETVRAALRIIVREPDRRQRLMRNARLAREALQSLGLRLRPGSTPILAVYVGDEEATCRTFHHLLREGVYVNPVLPPAAQEPLLRISCQTIHTEQHIEQLQDALARVKKRLPLVTA
ncbi:MAG: aminotransferase class I/II-fold pyridoxal phosphate-dependent enzyme [Planctomycetota bacterium]